MFSAGTGGRNLASRRDGPGLAGGTGSPIEVETIADGPAGRGDRPVKTIQLKASVTALA